MSPGKSPGQLWGRGGEGESWVWESSLWSCQDHRNGVDGVFHPMLAFQKGRWASGLQVESEGPSGGGLLCLPFPPATLVAPWVFAGEIPAQSLTIPGFLRSWGQDLL